MKSAAIAALTVLSATPLFSCAGKRPSTLGVKNGLLAPCPFSPNCASSDTGDSGHHVTPFLLALPPEKAWAVARELVSAMARTHIVTERPDYLHAECRSFLFGFVDDLELHLRPSEGIIAVRSASRIGYSDFGVNRRRIEDLRASLIGWKVLK